MVCRLPAIAAVAPVAAISSTTPATAAPAAISTAAASATAAVAATSTATAATFGLRTRFIHHQVPAAKILAIEISNRAIRFFIVGDFDKGCRARFVVALSLTLLRT